jgi:hypothetical protein
MGAVVAVIQKLLPSIYGMLKHDRDLDGQKFYRIRLSRLNSKRVSQAAARCVKNPPAVRIV